MSSQYGQFCPVAVASEIFAERWTPLILRELVLGSTRFNDIQRGVPRMSRALLARRLRELEAHGVVKRSGERRIPPHAMRRRSSSEVVVRLGTWGQRWTAPSSATSLDSRAADVGHAPAHRAGPPARKARHRAVRLPRRARRASGADLLAGAAARRRRRLHQGSRLRGGCVRRRRPGRVHAGLARRADDSPGQLNGSIRLSGERRWARAFPSWLLLSTLARGSAARQNNPKESGMNARETIVRNERALRRARPGARRTATTSSRRTTTSCAPPACSPPRCRRSSAARAWRSPELAEMLKTMARACSEHRARLLDAHAHGRAWRRGA